MPRSYVTLAEHPTDMVRLACTKCDRRVLAAGSLQRNLALRPLCKIDHLGWTRGPRARARAPGRRTLLVSDRAESLAERFLALSRWTADGELARAPSGDRRSITATSRIQLISERERFRKA
jgi:hypothetical protein